MDRLHHPSGQIGRDGTPVPEFFSVERAEIHNQEHNNPHSGKPESTKPTQIALWAGCKNWRFLSFSVDPNYRNNSKKHQIIWAFAPINFSRNAMDPTLIGIGAIERTGHC